MILSAGGVFIACQKEANVEVLETQQDQGIEYPIPENAAVFTKDIRLVYEGDGGWFDTKGHGDPVSFGGASFYYLPKDIKNYEYYHKLLQGDKKSKYNILKFTLGVGMGSRHSLRAIPIIKIELPNTEEKERQLKWLKNSLSEQTDEVSLKSIRSLSSTMTLARAQEFFEQFRNASCDIILQCPCLPFQYAADGCHARAHYMRKLMADAGYDCKKIFLWATSGSLQADTKAGCCAAWGWHVAPLVKVKTGTFSSRNMVIDPSLFDGPVSIETWRESMLTNCAGYALPEYQQAIKPSYIYGRTANGNFNRDDDYSDTYATINQYSTYFGCDR